jgi:hypothetical protein
MNPYCNDDGQLCESEESLTEAAAGGGSFMGFFLGGLFANMFMPRRKPSSELTLPSNFSLEEDSAEMEISEEQKTFLSHVWAIDAGIRKSEQNGNWVRLFCLVCTVREMNEGQWKKFMDEDYPQRDFLMKQLLSLLNYLQEMFPENRQTRNLTEETLDALEQGDVNIDLDSLTFTFNEKPLEEAFPSG